MADEHYVVAISRRDSGDATESCQWFLSFFDLATLDEIDCDYVARGGKLPPIYLVERHINLVIVIVFCSSYFNYKNHFLVS